MFTAFLSFQWLWDKSKESASKVEQMQNAQLNKNDIFLFPFSGNPQNGMLKLGNRRWLLMWFHI